MNNKGLPLYLKIIIGLLLGILWAIFSAYMGWSQFTLDWIAPFGDIFINALKLIAMPLILFSIMKGISDLSDISSLGRLGVKTLLIYLVTTTVAITVGLTFVNSIKPGTLVEKEQRESNRQDYERFVYMNENVDFKDDIRLLKDTSDLKGSAGERQLDEDIRRKIETARETKGEGPLRFLVDMVPSNIFLSLNNSLMLQVIVFSIFFGIMLLMVEREKAKPLMDFIEGANAVFIKMVDVIMKGAPFFVFALLAGKMSEMAGDDLSNMTEIFMGLGWYSLTVILGLGFMVFLLYPFVAFLLTKKLTYRRFFGGIGPAQMLAFSTSSSAATLPVTMNRVRDHMGVSREVSSFVLPIGATVNMDGTSLYQAVAVVFLAQFHMVDLDIAQQLTIVLTATMASIGSAAVPSAGIIMLIIVLESVGLDPAWIAIIFPVDRILDMCRTVVNITGDATVTSIIGKTEGQLNVPEEKR